MSCARRAGWGVFLKPAVFAGLLAWVAPTPAVTRPADDPPKADAPAKFAPTPEQVRAGYDRAAQPTVRGKVYKEKLTPNWFAGDSKLWYRNDLKGGTKEFVLVDAEKGTSGPAFDHAKLAAGLSKAAGKDYAADKLPFDAIEFANNTRVVKFKVGGTAWTCDLTSYECTKGGPAGEPTPDKPTEPPAEDAALAGSPWSDGATPEPREAAEFTQPPKKEERRAVSPDEEWTAFVRDGNVFVRGPKGDEKQLTKDGREGLSYGGLSWSPDSKSLAAWRTEPGDRKEVYLVESSPKGGGPAKLHTRGYPQPGDRYAAHELHLFDVATGKETKPDVEKVDFLYFGTPRLRWAKDSKSFTYEKTDRGHQRFRVIEVDVHTGKARHVIDEKTDTFIATHYAYGLFVRYLDATGEIVFASERSGWRHLYLIDAKTGEVKNPITKGDWVVRGVDRIDEEKREIWFRASGVNPGQDPYLVHHYRVKFDGTGLVALTEGDGDHAVQISPDRKYLIDTYSRVDAPPVHELRRISDGKLVCKLEEGDISEIRAGGWQAPEVFVAKGRDGTTDIWGIICRPRDFDPAKKYPVVEYIYAGPQDSFVPKRFAPVNRFSWLTELGFIVVQIDGMGTANRSKKFHDVCWKNLKDAGFPDRILWHKAAAAKYPQYDASRVGIYGGSAGGQNALGALLFHGDFYSAAMASCGCHDNRLDKASWNEQWMGYPVGPHYAACSNVDNAHRLTGKLLLIVGEMDTNVPPESTMRVADALIKAGKEFELLVVPGMGHSDGGNYGRRRLQDFFVKHLHGATPPDHNAPKAKKPAEQPVAAEQPDDKKADPIPVAPPPREKLDLAAFLKPAAESAAVVRRYDADRGALLRAYAVPFSPTRDSRLKKFHADWLAALKAVDFEKVSPEAREELLALRSRVESESKELEARAAEFAAVAPLLPFAEPIIGLEESRRRMERVDPQKAAAVVAGLKKEIEKQKAAVEESLKKDELAPGLPATKANATRAADAADTLRGALKTWFTFHDGYDPMFTWWLAEPYKQADAALDGYAKFLRDPAKKLPAGEKATPKAVTITPPAGPPDVADLGPLLATPRSEFAGVLNRYGGRGGVRDTNPGRWLDAMDRLPFDKLTRPAQVDYLLFKARLTREAKLAELRGKDRPPVPKDDTGIVGRPIGRDALMAELAGEMIPYTPEELIALAKAELEWCDAEVRKASREMGFGDDWRKATEKVKTLHVEPGGQPKLIRELSDEAIAYLKANDLVTVPALAEETWRMAMMSPDRQLFSPFFTGGEVITVAFPTNTMSHEAKLQSLRGNNVHFSRATVHHELIPGHHLQQFMNARHHPQRGMFSTPFWIEGWALYWEFVLYQKGFPKTPEDRIGFLTWRKHRCCRIIFSLSYHMGLMTPRQCIDLLIDRVGFEPENATAEVRRSFAGGYPPLYQAAYMLGGKQFWALRRELVDGGKMTDRQFHDAILAEHAMPVAMVRAVLLNLPLTPDGPPAWRFAGDPLAAPNG